MTQEEALKVLGLEADAPVEVIKYTASQKQKELQSKIDSAPTDALKAKFQQLLDKVIAAEQALSSTNSSPASQHSSPLSKTKMADLPGAAPVSEDSTTQGQQQALQAGTVLAGRYEIKEQIGAGGMGAVYRAYDKNRDEDIAIKVLLTSLTSHERARERFLDEARLSTKLSHPNIVNVYDVQQDGDTYFITMELLEGQDLRQVMENRKLARQPFSIEEVQDIIGHIATALDYAHKQTVHRDIKPENIWLTEDDEVKLMDFGIARLMSTSQRTQTGAAMGTAYYMAPEQLKGSKNIDGRADQYALAVMAYELLTGEVPAGAMIPINELRKDVPKGLSEVITQALSPKPELRFDSAGEFVEGLKNSSKGNKLPAMAKKTAKVSIAIIIGVIVMIFATLVVSDYMDRQATKEREAVREQREADAKAKRLNKMIKSLDLVKVPGGSFQMGSDSGDIDEKPVHRVNIKAFKLMSKEVTFAQYDVYAKATGKKLPHDRNWGRADRPVIFVNWQDAKDFAKWLSKQTGKDFRLPTEAEWEYACRSGGKDQKYCGGSNESSLAWYKGNSGSATNKVGQKPPNGLGLYDMSGNVWEWTEDCWNGSYKDASMNGAAWLVGDCSKRVLRGGAWSSDPNNLRSANRSKFDATYQGIDDGFRLVQD